MCKVEELLKEEQMENVSLFSSKLPSCVRISKHETPIPQTTCELFGPKYPRFIQIFQSTYSSLPHGNTDWRKIVFLETDDSSSQQLLQ